MREQNRRIMRIKSPKNKKSVSPRNDEVVDLELEKTPNVVLASSKRPMSTKIKIKSKFVTVGERNIP